MSVSATVDVEAITARAVQIKPLRVLLWLVAAPFIVLGVALRLLWLAPAFLISAAMQGWTTSDKMIKRWQVAARESASRGG